MINTIPYHSEKYPPKGKTLVFAPHPDDEIFGCGGAIMRHIQQKDKVEVVIVTDGGLVVHQSQRSKNYTKIRKQESLLAAKILGYDEPKFLDYPDGSLVTKKKLTNHLFDIICKLKPLNIYIPAKSEIHPDHLALFHAATDAAKAYQFNVNLIYYEIGQMQDANFLLDITDLQSILEKAMDCFQSQLVAQDYKRHINALHQYRTYTLSLNIKYAEAYHIINSKSLKKGSDLWLKNRYILDLPKTKETETVLHPLISVIVRTMNRPELTEALSSISQQTYPNLQVIVVDAIGDNTLKLGNQCGSYPIIVVTKNKALNRPEAANAGLNAVEGKYFCFLDEDDLLLPDHIEKLQMCLANKNAPAAYSIVERVDKNFNHEFVYGQKYSFLNLIWENFIPNLALLFRKEVINRGCLFDSNFSLYEDWDFLIQVAQFGDFEFIESKGGVYRNLNSSGIFKEGDLVRNYRKKIFEKWLPILNYEKVNSIAKNITSARSSHRKMVAHLFFRIGDHSYNEKDSLCKEVNEDIRSLNFNINHSEQITALRFDPLDDYVQLRIHKISLLNNGIPIEHPIQLSSNALDQDGSEYLFNTQDPQFFIQFITDENLIFDQLKIDIQYLKTGYKAFELLQIKAETKIQDLQIQNDQLNNEKKDLQNQVHRLEENFHRLQVDFHKLERNFNNLNDDIEKRDVLITFQSNTISEKDIEIQTLKETTNNLQNINIHMIKSFSWRITSPLRIFQRGAWQEWLKKKKQVEIIRKSSYFDKEYYLENNKDVQQQQIDPARHYLDHGGFEGRQPSANFDSSYYLEEYPDVMQSGINPLVHFLQFGRSEERRTKKSEISDPNDISLDLQLIKKSGLFDKDFYLRSNQDVFLSGVDPLEHFYLKGGFEGRNPSEAFETYYYLSAHKDAKISKKNPLIYYLQIGKSLDHLTKPIQIIEEECAKKADLTQINITFNEFLHTKMAVFFHLFHLDLAEEFIKYFKNIPINFDLYISTPFNQKTTVEKLFNNVIPNAHCIIIPFKNQGRDIKPFIELMDLHSEKYDVVCKVHTKTSDHNYNLIGWRKYLLDQLLGNSMIIKQILFEFHQNERLGLYWPVAYPYLTHIGMDKGWGSHWSKEKNIAYAQQYLPDYELNIDDEITFPNGSMFWFRPKALSPLLELKDKFQFEEEQLQIDGTLAHAIERLLGLISLKGGFQNQTMFFRKGVIQNSEINRVKLPNSGRILFISHDLYRAGAQIVLLTSLQWIKKHTSVELSVLAIKRGTDGGKLLMDFQKCAKVFIWDEYNAENNDKIAMKQIQNEIGSVDLIYGNTIIAASLYSLLEIFNAPYLTHIHELEKSIQKYTNEEIRESMKKYSDYYMADSIPVKNNLISNHEIPESNITVVEEFIHTEPDYVIDKVLNRKILNLPTDKILIWGCGTIYWRKGTDIFIKTAKILKDRGLSNFHFYWIGENHWDADQEGFGKWEDWEKYMADHQLSDVVSFLGSKDQPKKYFNSGDIFFLSSREEPFGIVCLEAAEGGSPIVCFDQVGGMPDFVGQDAGSIVESLDEESAAIEIEKLIKNQSIRIQKGENARQKLLLSYSDEIAVPRILQVCQNLINKPPMVSIIVPVYNHEKYIKERMDSILNQTFKDFEIIVLDDASTDQSIEILKKYESHPAVSIYKNATNSGSTYLQWQKGVSMAKGNYIWIAEGDDDSEPIFLDRLLSCSIDSKVKLAYCASSRIDENSNAFPQNYIQLGHYDNLKYPRDRWELNYNSNGLDEIINVLGIRCTIPNVSAVLFKADALKKFDFSECKYFLTSGDWFTYISLLKEGKIAYEAEELNHHRIHSHSVISKNKQKAQNTLPSYYKIHEFVLSNFNISEDVFKLMIKSVTQELRYLWPEMSDDEFSKYYNSTNLEKLFNDKKINIIND